VGEGVGVSMGMGMGKGKGMGTGTGRGVGMCMRMGMDTGIACHTKQRYAATESNKEGDARHKSPWAAFAMPQERPGNTLQQEWHESVGWEALLIGSLVNTIWGGDPPFSMLTMCRSEWDAHWGAHTPAAVQRARGPEDRAMGTGPWSLVAWPWGVRAGPWDLKARP